ncbi:MAG TPA: carbamoyltransferase HypF [Gammaproteobacteria bacterium]|nr:carbamoyltransferase HypF [Gammaproteobacteria bacterium]
MTAEVNRHLPGRNPSPDGAQAIEAVEWRLDGRVQGVGFRPFVYRLARAHGLTGWVQNRLGQVVIRSCGPAPAQQAFGRALIEQAPPLARPRLCERRRIPCFDAAGFDIRTSAAHGERAVHLPPDGFTCDACLAELHDARDRRYRYPFINCTQCGPRYTLIRSLPYDRSATSMAGFTLCPDCAREYRNPADRRFHAEPVACPACGPALRFVATDAPPVQGDEAALAAACRLLAQGGILAVKGIGGYHLLCDARSDAAVARLRERKRRPDKPLAVLFPAPPQAPLQALAADVELDDEAAAALRSPGRPIVLLPRRRDSRLAPGIAPGLDEVGVMLPYSPLHHLLLEDFGAPLVATSGNLSGEPVLTDEHEAQARLAGIADAFLHHDRPILRPADDPLLRRLGGRLRPLRLGRGTAPLEMELPFRLPAPVLAAGGHLKNTLALAWDRRVVVSPHIGDMGSARSLAVFEQLARDLQAVYGVQAAVLLCDAHPDYATSRWARRQGLPVQPVFHHEAHASALAGEHGGGDDWLVFSWDGTGLGRDGSLWGGEALAGAPGHWQRVASLRPFRLPGGDRVAREPWRSAWALCREHGHDWRPPDVAAGDLELLAQAWERGLNTPTSSAAGRLFDAAAALLGVCHRASYEGQAPMQLEALCAGGAAPLALPLQADAGGVWRSDWRPLVDDLLDGPGSAAHKAQRFHASLAAALVAQAEQVRRQRKVRRVGLCGGVFQNRVLTALAVAGLRAAGFEVCLNRQLPASDAGLAFGQVVEYAATLT